MSNVTAWALELDDDLTVAQILMIGKGESINCQNRK